MTTKKEKMQARRLVLGFTVLIWIAKLAFDVLTNNSQGYTRAVLIVIDVLGISGFSILLWATTRNGKN